MHEVGREVPARVVGAGWHDVCIRWDISVPQPVVARLHELPGQGSLSRGKKLLAERDRFGKWCHLLGPQNVLLVYTVESPQYGMIRRLEVQAHLGDAGEDDLCSVAEFHVRWRRLQLLMAGRRVLPIEDPVYVRVDPAIDVEYEDGEDGRRVLEALRYARWPRGWYAEWQGPPPYTTVAIKSNSKTVARAYCRNTKLKNGKPRWGKLRFEREQRFTWSDQRPVEELGSEEVAAMFWGSAFGSAAVSGKARGIPRESQSAELIERVSQGEISCAQFEQLAGFLDAERLGLVERVYRPETARRRRKLARHIGLAVSDPDAEQLDVDLDELLAAPRARWAA
jgi:hypothetical protein